MAANIGNNSRLSKNFYGIPLNKEPPLKQEFYDNKYMKKFILTLELNLS